MASFIRALSWKAVWDSIRKGKIIDWLSYFAAGFSAASLALLTLLMTAYVISRKFGEPIAGAFQLSEQLVVAVVIPGTALVALRKGHICIDIFSERFSTTGKLWLEQISNIMGMGLSFAVAWWGWMLAIRMMAMKEFVASGLVRVPVWPFRIIVAAAFTLWGLQLLVVFIRNFKRPIQEVIAQKTNIDEDLKLAGEISSK